MPKYSVIRTEYTSYEDTIKILLFYLLCSHAGWTALHAAAHAGHAASISLLIRRGASTAARAKRGWTPLHSACMRGRWQAARALLAAGADANARALDQVRRRVVVFLFFVFRGGGGWATMSREKNGEVQEHM